MKIRILKGTTIGAKDVNPGEVYEVDQNTKVVLVDHAKFAEVVPDDTPLGAPAKAAPAAKDEPLKEKKGKQ